MSSTRAPTELQRTRFILVTGANSGLGFSICCRLVDDFLSKQPETQSLTVIFTTRSARKGNETLDRLKSHLRRTSGGRPDSEARVSFQSENVDLTDLFSVRALSRRLLQSTPKLDAIVLNAGLGGFKGINWFEAIYGIITSPIHQSTWPSYKLSDIGILTKKQTSLPKEPPLGDIFCANVFGHYMLAHAVAPLLTNSKNRAENLGRIIWISSIEAVEKFFDPTDIQGLRAPAAYESSKRLTDLLALTSTLPSSAPWVNSFLSSDSSKPPASELKSTPESTQEEGQESLKPNIYVAHPGICGTSIVPLPLPLHWAMLAAFWLARILGSPWHGVSPYLGACAPVWLCLASQSILDTAESAYSGAGGGKPKWGSSCDRLGRGSPASTEVDGWGHGGVVGSFPVKEDGSRRRRRDAKDVTVESREEFEEQGRECWRAMEELRIEWERILDAAEAES